jgi:AI-2 transport protein TqsA
MLVGKIRRIFGSAQEVQSHVSAAFREMAESVRSYLVWRTIVNIGLGIVLGAVYAAAGLKQPVLWALLTVIFCYIPYLGTIAAGVMPILDALLNVNPLVAFGLLIFYVTIVTIEGYLIVPWVMGRSMDLNATTVLISCLYWYLVWGTGGLFLAMPMMAAIKAICMQVPGWAALGNLMGSLDAPTATLDDVVKLDVAAPQQTHEAVKTTLDA